VPANVPLALSVLDKQGRRISPRHLNWLQLRPGEVRACNGCHNPGPGTSHGRSGTFASAWAGATADGQPFPHTDPALFADFGESMADARARISCATDCAAIVPSVDIRFDDVWTDPATAGRAKDASFAWRYADLTTAAPLSPSSTACPTTWNPRCRIVINYEQHVHPLWGVQRRVLDGNGALVADHTCNTCHSPRDANGAAQVPASQLDLSDGASPDVPDRFNSYQELLATDNEQALINGALQDRQVQVGVDPVTQLPVFQPVPVGPPMSTAGARASGAFFSRFAPGASHAGWLSDAELRLVSEWIDLGGQYFNNPFDAPLN
jgi:hypothetical protein